jgi:uncharacterized protein YaiL (DUF2058 family)
MSLSLKDQLIAAGLVKRGPPAPKPQHPRGKAAQPVSVAKAAKAPSEPSLAELYRARDQQAEREKQAAQRLAAEKALAKRERKNRAVALIAGKALNVKDAEHARHFEYGRKIRRLYVNSEQREQLNAGLLGIAQMDGTFSLVTHAVLLELQSFAPEFVALMGASAEAPAPAVATDYQDAKYQIPDDLTW